MKKVSVNEIALNKALDEHPEVLAEAIQTVLRAKGIDTPYEKLKELTRGKHITLESMRVFIQQLSIDDETKKSLLELTAHTYLGNAHVPSHR